MVDEGVTAVRDAIAHGRVASPSTSDSMHLIKFDRPTDKNASHVRVSENVVVDVPWMRRNIGHVLHQAAKVAEAHETLHGGSRTSR